MVRAAHFEVDRRFLADLLHLPTAATITAVYGDYDGRAIHFIVDDPALPEAGEPHNVYPTLFEKRTEWDWNVPA